MRPAIYVALVIACAAAAPEFGRAAVASAASVIVESLPYLAASALLSPWLGRFAPPAVAYAGCGCAPGPAARSIPAAVATAALFGPYVAAARWIAAIAVSRLRREPMHHERDAPLLDDLVRLAPSAALCGIAAASSSQFHLAHQPAVMQAAAGAMLGFIGAPCALGAVALAASVRAQSTIAATAILAIAGIVDARVWWRRHEIHATRDRVAYTLLAIACTIIAHERGASLVHPRLTWALWACAALCAWYACVSRTSHASVQRVIAAGVLFAALLGARAPAVVANEAMLDDSYPGERVDFTGEYVATAAGPRLVRYAITCCRADARPVALALARTPREPPHTWLRVSGVMRRRDGALMLEPDAILPVTPPADPFIYR